MEKEQNDLAKAKIPLREWVMPFTGHTARALQETLLSIANSDLAVELFDAFLSEYVTTGSLEQSLFFAQCEWDV